eukprot:m.95708 g.95708  ORF g.95708 m.95708 type:complete len:298 (-) comp13509_c0_seq1:40-933(-)
MSQVELAFARKLAHNDVTVRNRAVKKLKLFLARRKEEFTEMELLKLWKGLFYCMWMSDKPLIQEEVARRLASLTHSFKTNKGAFAYIEAFFKTMEREWQGIDRLRLDKFYNLLSNFINAGYTRCKNQQWNEDVLNQYCHLLLKGPFRVEDINLPIGITRHTVEITLKTLVEIGDVTDSASKIIIDMMLGRMETAPKPTPFQIKQHFFEGLLFLDANEDDAGGISVDWDELSQEIMKRGSDRDTKQGNRKMLYSLNAAIKEVLCYLGCSRSGTKSSNFCNYSRAPRYKQRKRNEKKRR